MENYEEERTPKGYAEPDETAIARLGADLVAGRKRVFFYAASGFDWQPLHRFSHKCDCFVYVDPRVRAPARGSATCVEFETERLKLEHGQTRARENLTGAQLLAFDVAYTTLTDVVGPLAQMRNAAWARIPNLQNRPAWGAVQKLKRRVGGRDRIIWLLFIAGSPSLVYRRLFIETGTAPVFLAFRAPNYPAAPGDFVEFQNQWEQLAGWNGELGQLLNHNDAPLPQFLANDGITMGWPTVATHYRIPHWSKWWNMDIDSLNLEAWPDFAPGLGAGRRVVLTRSPINPYVTRGAGAVVLTNEKYRQYVWPEHTLAIISGPPACPEYAIDPEYAIPDGPSVVNINIVTTPLLQALARVEEVCAQRGITKVAVQGVPGFEDEADDLALWRNQDGPIKELTIHCECDGHFLDFAPAADQIG